jgi:hypothetical protein
VSQIDGHLLDGVVPCAFATGLVGNERRDGGQDTIWVVLAAGSPEKVHDVTLFHEWFASGF